jgi:hypothetical protein
LIFVVVIVSVAIGSAGIIAHVSNIFEGCHAAFFLFRSTKFLNF